MRIRLASSGSIGEAPASKLQGATGRRFRRIPQKVDAGRSARSSRPAYSRYLRGGNGDLRCAHHWGREAEKLGHEVKLVPLDIREAIRQASEERYGRRGGDHRFQHSAFSMSFVAVKTEEQQARGMLFRTRDLLVLPADANDQRAATAIWRSLA